MNRYEIGFPTGRALLVSHKEIDATRIMQSFGGGMGGATETFYATTVATFNDFIRITNIDGRIIELYKQFIVQKEPVTLLYLVTNNSANYNYGKDTNDKVIQHQYFAFNEAEEYVLIHDYSCQRETPLVYQWRTINGDIK